MIGQICSQAKTDVGKIFTSTCRRIPQTVNIPPSLQKVQKHMRLPPILQQQVRGLQSQPQQLSRLPLPLPSSIKPMIEKTIQDLSSRKNGMLNSIHQRSTRIKLVQPQLLLKQIHLPPLSVISVSLSSFKCNIEHNLELPFSRRGGSTTVQKKKKRNNTGFYYGITDDVFFPDDRERQEISSSLSPSSSSSQENKSKSFASSSETKQKRKENVSSSALADIMGETLLELREMREDLMTLREEMHYMKEEMKRSNGDIGTPYNEENISGDEDDDDLLQTDYPEHHQRVGSFVDRVKRQREFDFISKDVEKWAHKMLFEETGEEHGWKKVVCNKMVRSKFNKDGSTKCYIKWMKDSRNESSKNANDETEYPCIKCYATINAPLENVCEYLSQECHMAEYNDLVVAYRDMESITPQSKICWSQCPQILFIKPRDFVTFCHHRWRKDGTQIVVNQACEHEDAPGIAQEGEGKACRAHALRGANFISRDPEDPTKTRMAILAHANPGGGIPQWAMKTAVNAVAPIEPYKLFHRIDVKVRAFCSTQDQKTNMVNSGYTPRPAGLSQLGYACFWPTDDLSVQQKAHGEYISNLHTKPQIHGEKNQTNGVCTETETVSRDSTST